MSRARLGPTQVPRRAVEKLLKQKHRAYITDVTDQGNAKTKDHMMHHMHACTPSGACAFAIAGIHRGSLPFATQETAL